LPLALLSGRVYSEILVPTDGSDASAAAVAQGVAVAERFDATVHFLHVVDVGVEMSASAVGTVADDLTETFEKVADDALDAAESRAAEVGVPNDRTILEGVPHEAIADYAEDHGIDLVVLGATGRSGLGERLLGSTTDRVAHSVDASVLIARE
jgi:nucleotide-binding universal stress UspA family protein